MRGKRLLCGWALACMAGQAQASDLMDIYRQAVLHDAQYAAAQAQRHVGDERQIQGRAGLLPQVTFDTQTSWSETEYDVSGGTLEQRRQNRSYGIQLVQPLFRWQRWLQYEQGNQQRALAETRLASAEQALMLRVVESYFEVLNASDVLDAVEQLQAANAEQLASARKHFELGNASITDVHEAQASFDRTMAQLIKARSDLALARHALARIIGGQPERIKGLLEHVELAPPQPEDASAWVIAAESGSLEVQTQVLLLEIAAKEVQSRKAEFLPTVDMVLSQNMQQSPNASTERSESAAIGLRLSMPLYSGGRLSSSAREAVALRIQAEHELEDARRAATLATRQAWSGVMDGIAQIKALEAAKVSAQSAVNSNQLGYKLGVRVGTDVLDAQSQFSETLQQLSRARYDTFMAQLQLKAAVGSLGIDDLTELNALLADVDEQKTSRPEASQLAAW
ncbi:TolC family outer membrane protein [Pseudomonas lopnurensis]|uniref:TolC family outer membrane protein n=1 Tax=Pseudomonas lopnurensis TaxID=1477517 RepID=UPI0028AE95C2|nr:TolC family outer membrane protein [Pseudomonas lopnurensis]